MLDLLQLGRGVDQQQRRLAATADDHARSEVAMQQNEMEARLAVLEAEADILARQSRREKDAR